MTDQSIADSHVPLLDMSEDQAKEILSAFKEMTEEDRSDREPTAIEMIQDLKFQMTELLQEFQSDDTDLHLITLGKHIVRLSKKTRELDEMQDSLSRSIGVLEDRQDNVVLFKVKELEQEIETVNFAIHHPNGTVCERLDDLARQLKSIESVKSRNRSPFGSIALGLFFFACLGAASISLDINQRSQIAALALGSGASAGYSVVLATKNKI
jgi:hypothetical protein